MPTSCDLRFYTGESYELKKALWLLAQAYACTIYRRCEKIFSYLKILLYIYFRTWLFKQQLSLAYISSYF